MMTEVVSVISSKKLRRELITAAAALSSMEVKKMAQALEIFKHAEFGEVRVIERDGEIYFVAADVCKVLELTNPTVALESLDEDERSKFNLGRQGEANAVNESGLYALVLKSRKPNAKKLRKWLTGEVVPSIRKSGMYINPNAPIDPRFLRRMADELEARDKKIAALQPKADYCEKVLESSEHLTSELIAKEYGKPAHWLHETLIKLGVMYMRKRGKKCYYYLKSPYDKGNYRDSETVTLERGKTVVNHYWTQRGRHFVYQFLKKRVILPTLEREEYMEALL